MKRKNLLFLLFAVMFVSSCAQPIEMFGVGETVTEKENSESASNPSDDTMAEKKPLSIAVDHTVVESFNGCSVRLNKTATITALDIGKLDGDAKELETKVFGGRGEALSFVEELATKDINLIPSLEVVNGSMKPFNDGLYATIELSVQSGLKRDEMVVYPSKQEFLQRVIDALAVLKDDAEEQGETSIDAAIVDVAAALILGGEAPEVNSSLLVAAEKLAESFGENALFSKPIGFYAWSEELSHIFSQDRFLQNYQGEEYPYADSEFGKAAALFLAVSSDESLKKEYEKYLMLLTGLTNPFMNYSVLELQGYVSTVSDLEDIAGVNSAFLAKNPRESIFPECNPRFALFPTSESKETLYFEKMFCDYDGAPDGLNYLDELVRAIKDGNLDLAPNDDSGWYDYMSYALETLLLPEKSEEHAHLLLSAAYKEKLVETFKSIIIQNRETHVKQLEMGTSNALSAGSTEFDLYPQFSVEPFPTFYLRSARAYRFLQTYLEAVLGSEFMEMVARRNEDGSYSAAVLSEELKDMTQRLYGLYFIASGSVGTIPQLLEEELAEFSEEECRANAARWLESWKTDRDILKDPRVVVPVQKDVDRNEVIYWGVTGVKAIKISAEFEENHRPEIINSDEYCTFSGEYLKREYYLLMETTTEFRLSDTVAPPTRDEFRAVCDKYDTNEEIKNALEEIK